MVQSRPFNFFYLASTSTVSTLSCGRFSQLFSHVERIYFSTPILKSFSWADGERQKVNVFANQGLMALSIFLHLIKFVVWAGGWAFRKYFLGSRSVYFSPSGSEKGHHDIARAREECFERIPKIEELKNR